MTETMSSFQALVTGAIAGALAKASEDFLLIAVEIMRDEDGDYTNEIFVRGRESGDELIVQVLRAEDE